MEAVSHPETTVHFESFELDLRTHELYRNGSRLKVRGHPVEVLAILLEHPGELVTRETLQKRIWPDDTFVDFEQILNNSVGKIRDALGDKAESPHFIETLPRLGYRFIAPIEKFAISNQAPETKNQEPQVAPTAELYPAVMQAAQFGVHRITKHRILWPAIAVAAIFAAFGYWYLHRRLPAPQITHYEQLTLDGRRKSARGTDGTRIYMDLIGPGQGIAQIPVSGGKVTEFPIDSLPGTASWLTGVSPDGSSLLVINQVSAEEGFKLWIVGTLGHPARYLARAWAYSAAWSPDGRTVVYADARGDIYTISVNGGEPRLLHREDGPVSQVTHTRDASWSPDGSTIRFTRWGGRIFEMSATGANLHEWLPGWNGAAPKCCGRWTPDGQFFVFLAGRTLAKSPQARSLAQMWIVDERYKRMRPHIAEPILLASDPLLWGNPIPSRDGKKVFARGVSFRGELERYDPTSKRLEPYLDSLSAEMLNFSRDGKYVAYVSFPEGILWRANRDGGGQLQLTEPPFYPRNPRWSPDGTKVLFTDNTQNGVDTLYIVSSQGGAPKRLLPDDGGPQSLGDWSPDGTRVAYTTFPAFSFVPSLNLSKVETRIVELATGRVTILPEREGGFFAPLWSPDGRFIAGGGRYTPGRYFDARELVIFDIKTEKWNTLIQKEDIGFHNWSHDGRFIYFPCRIQGKVGVYRVSVPGGKEELVFNLPDGFRGTGWYDFSMSLDPDDVPILFRDMGTDEIYALTLGQK